MPFEVISILSSPKNVFSSAFGMSFLEVNSDYSFNLDSKNIDIHVEKTPEGVEVKVEAKGVLWKAIAKRIVKFVLRRFKVGK